jgi:hypothetical protein
LERLENILDGGWLELAVISALRETATYGDFHWSVAPRRGQDAYGEANVVCLNLERGAVHVISCKTSLEKPLEHLEALRERSLYLGGRFAEATLAILHPRP